MTLQFLIYRLAQDSFNWLFGLYLVFKNHTLFRPCITCRKANSSGYWQSSLPSQLLLITEIVQIPLMVNAKISWAAWRWQGSKAWGYASQFVWDPPCKPQRFVMLFATRRHEKPERITIGEAGCWTALVVFPSRQAAVTHIGAIADKIRRRASYCFSTRVSGPLC